MGGWKKKEAGAGEKLDDGGGWRAGWRSRVLAGGKVVCQWRKRRVVRKSMMQQEQNVDDVKRRGGMMEKDNLDSRGKSGADEGKKQQQLNNKRKANT